MLTIAEVSVLDSFPRKKNRSELQNFVEFFEPVNSGWQKFINKIWQQNQSPKIHERHHLFILKWTNNEKNILYKTFERAITRHDTKN